MSNDSQRGDAHKNLNEQEPPVIDSQEGLELADMPDLGGVQKRRSTLDKRKQFGANKATTAADNQLVTNDIQNLDRGLNLEKIPAGEETKSVRSKVMSTVRSDRPVKFACKTKEFTEENRNNQDDCSDTCTENEQEGEEQKGEGGDEAVPGAKKGDGEEAEEGNSRRLKRARTDLEDIVHEESKEDDSSSEDEDNDDKDSLGDDNSDDDDDDEEGGEEGEQGEDEQEEENFGDDEDDQENNEDEEKEDEEEAGSDKEKDKKKEKGEAGRLKGIKKRFLKLQQETFSFEDMVGFCGESYQVIKCWRDLKRAVETHEGSGKELDVVKDLRRIGAKSDRTKALIYAIQEVERFPLPAYRKALAKRREQRANPLLIKHVDLKPFFDSYVEKSFPDPVMGRVKSRKNLYQKRYNAFMLFMLNNSQDELLMAFTDFCKKYFSAGLPNAEYGTMPQKYTNIDFKELRAFISREDIMNETQFRLAVAKNLDGAKWKAASERDADGNPIKLIEYKDALPFIMVGFYCYITNEIDKREAQIADGGDPDQGPAKNSKTSLAACFEKAGLKREEWKRRVITYSMTENALLFYMDKHVLSIDQIELVLRMVRERMTVHQQYRSESAKEYFDHVLPRKSFGRWLMAELALQKCLKERAREQQANKGKTREQFRRTLVYEEKMHQMAINMDKLEHGRFTKLVTKNLLIILHARKKFAAYLDLDNHPSVKDALMAHLGVESAKAKNIIGEEYKAQALDQQVKADQVHEQIKKRQNDPGVSWEVQDVATERMKLRFGVSAADTMTPAQKAEQKQAQPKEHFNKWNKINKMIIEQRELYEEKVSVPSIYKLFKDTLWKTYWHTHFIDKNKRNKNLQDENYKGPTNLTHFTVHEFNEALYFATREFSTYVNFAQIEAATYHFFMDDFLREEVGRNTIKLKKEKQKNWEWAVLEASRLGKAPPDPPKEKVYPDTATYPTNAREKVAWYSRIFVDEYDSKSVLNELQPIKGSGKYVYQDRLPLKKEKICNNPQKPPPKLKAGPIPPEDADDEELPEFARRWRLRQHLRGRDLKKLERMEHMANPLQTEVEAFRSFKLCDLEFTRYAYQILMEEAHRQAMQTMSLMYLSSPRCRASHRPEEGAAKGGEDASKYAEYYERLKRNHYLKKKDLAAVREAFKEERIKRIKVTKARQGVKKLGLDTNQHQQEVELSDLHHPLNHFGYQRFDKWLANVEAEHDEPILAAPDPNAKSALFQQKLDSDQFNFFKKLDPVQPVGTGQDDMINILLTMNYMTGFVKHMAESQKKQNEKQAQQEEDDEDGSQDENDKAMEEAMGDNLEEDEAFTALFQKYGDEAEQAMSKRAPSQLLSATQRSLTISHAVDESKPESVVDHKLQDSDSDSDAGVRRPQFKFNQNINEPKPVRALLIDDSDDDTGRNKVNSRSGKSGSRDKRLISGSVRSDKMGSTSSKGRMGLGEKIRQQQIVDHEDIEANLPQGDKRSGKGYGAGSGKMFAGYL